MNTIYCTIIFPKTRRVWCEAVSAAGGRGLHDLRSGRHYTTPAVIVCASFRPCTSRIGDTVSTTASRQRELALTMDNPFRIQISSQIDNKSRFRNVDHIQQLQQECKLTFACGGTLSCFPF